MQLFNELKLAKRKFVWVVSIFWTSLLCAQKSPIPFRYFSIQDGLADWTVTAMVKDPTGLLWIGTAHGLQRYDGYKFMTFNTNVRNPYSISDHYVQSLKLLQDGQLLVTYLRNAEFFDLINHENFEKKTIFLKKSGINPAEQVQSIKIDDDGNILVFTISILQQRKMVHLYEFDYSLKRFRAIVTLTSDYLGEPNDQLFDAIKVDKHQWLLGNNKDRTLLLVKRWHILKRFTSKDFLGEQLPVTAFGERISILKRDRRGQVWIAFAHNPYLFRYNARHRSFQVLKGLPKNGEYSLWWQDKKGNVLVSKTDGSTRFPISKNLYCITKKYDVHDFSKLLTISKEIVDVYSDDFFGTIFFGVDTGLKIFKNNQNIVSNYLQKEIDSDDFGRIMRGMASDQKGNIYFAGENTFWYKLNKNKSENKIDTIRIVEEKSDTVLKFNCCFDIQYEAPNFLWGIACQGRDKGLLIRYNLSTQKAKIYRYPARFRAFETDAQNRLWLLTEYPNGDYKLLIFNKETAEFRPFYTAEDPTPLRNLFPYFISASKDHNFWVTTNKGLYKVIVGNSFQDNQFKTYVGQTQLGTQLIYCVYEDLQGTVWLGSSQGLIRFNPNTLQEKYYTQADGLASNTISGILEDHRGKLWISTHNGISCFDPEKEHFTNFYDLDGFSHSSFTRYSFFRDEENTLYFGTINGVNTFKPENLTKVEAVPQVTLTRVSKFNRLGDTLIEYTKNLQKLSLIELAAAEQNLELEFTLPIYWDISKTKYRYKLENLDQKWIELDNKNQIKYHRLPAGRYKLLIQGADPRGNWSKSLEIQLHVATFFYHTWWFLILSILILITAVYFLLRYRLFQKLKVERLRTKISTDIHDEVSGLLAGIAMQAEALQLSKTTDLDKGKLAKIAEISRKAMSRLHDVIWSIDARKDRFEDLLLHMEEHASDVLLPLNIQYQVKVQYIDANIGIPIEIRQDLYYIFKEAINNVAKHAEKATMVQIRLGHNGWFFEMEILDNGQFFEASPKGTGQGMLNMKMRAKRIGGEIYFSHEKGFKVLLRMKRL